MQKKEKDLINELLNGNISKLNEQIKKNEKMIKEYELKISQFPFKFSPGEKIISIAIKACFIYKNFVFIY